MYLFHLSRQDFRAELAQDLEGAAMRAGDLGHSTQVPVELGVRKQGRTGRRIVYRVEVESRKESPIRRRKERTQHGLETLISLIFWWDVRPRGRELEKDG